MLLDTALLDIAPDILPVLWVVTAAGAVNNLVFHGPGIDKAACRTTAYLVYTWGSSAAKICIFL